jgi:hypothetical protein
LSARFRETAATLADSYDFAKLEAVEEVEIIDGLAQEFA